MTGIPAPKRTRFLARSRVLILSDEEDEVLDPGAEDAEEDCKDEVRDLGAEDNEEDAKNKVLIWAPMTRRTPARVSFLI